MLWPFFSLILCVLRVLCGGTLAFSLFRPSSAKAGTATGLTQKPLSLYIFSQSPSQNASATRHSFSGGGKSASSILNGSKVHHKGHEAHKAGSGAEGDRSECSGLFSVCSFVSFPCEGCVVPRRGRIIQPCEGQRSLRKVNAAGYNEKVHRKSCGL